MQKSVFENDAKDKCVFGVFSHCVIITMSVLVNKTEKSALTNRVRYFEIQCLKITNEGARQSSRRARAAHACGVAVKVSRSGVV